MIPIRRADVQRPAPPVALQLLTLRCQYATILNSKTRRASRLSPERMQLTSAGIFLPGEAMTSAVTLPFSFETAADNLLANGLQADKTELVRRLQAAGEYRLATYADYFRSGNGYAPGTTLGKVWRIYEFDHRLRSLCFEAIGNIEVQVRGLLAHCFAHRHGAFGYLDRANFPNFSSAGSGFPWWEGKIKDAIAGEQKDRPNIQPPFPIWDIAERMDFGMVLSFFQGVSSDIQKSIASTVGQSDKVVRSWLLSLRDLRNRCAHHHRIWNWHFKAPVTIPRRRKHPEWHYPAFPDRQRLGILITICRYWLNRIHPGNDWTERVFALFDAYPELPVSAMGLPADWRRHPLWDG